MAELYRHYRTHGLYEKLAEALHTETKQALVVYRSVADGQVWCRPTEMFYGTVETPEGTVPRFTRLEDA